MIYKLYTGGIASTSTSIDIREDDTITGILLEINSIGPGDGTMLWGELSFLASASTTTSDTNGVVAAIGAALEAGAAGTQNCSVPIHLTNLNIPVSAGERLYLHFVVGSGSTGSGSNATAFIYTAGAAQRPPTRRR